MNSQFKNNLWEKAKAQPKAWARETGYPFDGSRQIGNTS